MFTRSAIRLVRARPTPVLVQARFLNLQEYVSKGLLSQYGVSIQRGKPASSATEAEEVASVVKKMTGTQDLVIKAQILAGGRGKGTFDNGFKGGVKIAKTPAEIKGYAEKMLGAKLRTEQTPPEGIPVNKVLVAECIDIKRECYFAIVMDRHSQGPVMIASKRGGVNIEEVARDHPEDIFTEPMDIHEGATREKTLRLANRLGFHDDMAVQAAEQFERVYDFFLKADVTQVEINPLAETTDNRVVAVDAKINFDENAAYRQEDIFKQHDPTEDDPREIQAAKYNLNYVGLDGNIGCMVNGAGLAMATMDIIKLHGGKPANFLDVGGGATARQVTEAFKILTSDPKVQVILVNIFGGIMRCDVIAEGIITASKAVGLRVPLVVRLEGTNVKKGKEMLRESGINVITADDLDAAAERAVGLLRNEESEPKASLRAA